MIINKKYLKAYSPLPSNYDVTEVLNYVDIAERLWVVPVIGQDLYDEIAEQVSSNQVSEENATLLTTGGLWQFLSYATVLQGLAFLWVNISSIGITLGKSDNADSVSMKDLTYVENGLRRTVEILKDQLLDWLDSHADSFPLYVPRPCGCGSTVGNCGCGVQIEGRLNLPNPMQLVYTTRDKDTTLR